MSSWKCVPLRNAEYKRTASLKLYPKNSGCWLIVAFEVCLWFLLEKLYGSSEDGVCQE